MLTLQKLVSYFQAKPQMLFVVDGFGALLSGVLQVLVFILFERNNLVPSEFEISLMAMPFLFVLVDIVFFFISTKNVSRYIRLIAVLNGMFVLYSASFLILFFNELYILTFVYLVVELIIVLCIVLFELMLAKNLLTT